MMCTNLRIAALMICMLRLPRSCNAAVHWRITGLQRRHYLLPVAASVL